MRKKTPSSPGNSQSFLTFYFCTACFSNPQLLSAWFLSIQQTVVQSLKPSCHGWFLHLLLIITNYLYPGFSILSKLEVINTHGKSVLNLPGLPCSLVCSLTSLPLLLFLFPLLFEWPTHFCATSLASLVLSILYFSFPSVVILFWPIFIFFYFLYSYPLVVPFLVSVLIFPFLIVMLIRPRNM